MEASLSVQSTAKGQGNYGHFLRYISTTTTHSKSRHSIKLLLVILFLAPLRSVSTYSGYIDVGFAGSAMSYVDTDGDFLYSPGNLFSLSFYSFSAQALFYLCVMHMASKEVVWTANQDSPLSHSDQLVFSMDGNAALVGSNGTVTLWSSNTTGLGVKRMVMLDSGNLILVNGANETMWQSFDYPTDTLLSGQVLQKGMHLTSRVSNSNMSSGSFSLSLAQGDLKLLYATSSSSALSQTYWSMLQDVRLVSHGRGTPSYVRFDSTGLNFVSDNGAVVSSISWISTATLCKASLHPDGNLVIYVFSSNVWAAQFTALQNGCSLPLSCGPSGVCKSGQCSCPSPLQALNENNVAEGCRSLAAPSCTNVSSRSLLLQEIGDGLDYFANNYAPPASMSDLDGCKKLCMENCSCYYFFFYNDSDSCFLYSQLGTIQSTGWGRMLFVKTNRALESSNLTAPAGVGGQPPSRGLPSFLLPVILGSISFIVLALACAFMYWFFKMHRVHFPQEDDYAEGDDVFLDTISGLPTRFTLKELQSATKNFSKKLGEGGFGSVYEGVLPDKTKVAVKRLEGAGAGQGKKEFRAEVAIIGRVHHMHLVQLYGYCAEGSHRLLVYEFLANGSLDKCLFGEGKKPLEWNVRYQIALSTARGLAYLHDDCREKIIHCDIKPENILLDEAYNAKLSDFGLAKLVNKEQSQVFTTMRGTRGYLAPEWIMNLAISEKSDVYSFGMVLLETISGRKNLELTAVSEKRYFPSYAYEQVERGAFMNLADERLNGEAVCIEELIRAAKVALWCIQEEISIRPSMAKVVQMLEGSLKIPDPPSSSFAGNVQTNMKEVMNTSERSSSFSNISKSAQIAVQLSEAR
ncbi:hypothetical protein GOP47_0015170 [Adiantum capillus-veneris]|uniref:Receptor-like serine/threonine-protein kinase n=1 Tax=Adiantum capillus-veneris TaxID=13818 RepID=A0A9D4UNR6_ADICA|nr:hypothetical protein GOP47_0015170 [Adiantum capillus-veneris]